MPDPQQHARSTRVSSRGLELVFRAFGRRPTPKSKNTSSYDSSCMSTSSKNTQNEVCLESDNTNSSETQPQLNDNSQRKKKQVCLKLDADYSDSSSVRTSDSDPSAILSAVFKKLNLKSTSPSKKHKQPKSILRKPVRHIYVRGISGLPTQRVPVSRVCCHNHHF